MFDAMEFRLARVRKGWTIRKLAEVIGYSPVWLSWVEMGHRRPSNRLVKVWAQALGLTMPTEA